MMYTHGVTMRHSIVSRLIQSLEAIRPGKLNKTVLNIACNLNVRMRLLIGYMDINATLAECCGITSHHLCQLTL